MLKEPAAAAPLVLSWPTPQPCWGNVGEKLFLAGLAWPHSAQGARHRPRLAPAGFLPSPRGAGEKGLGSAAQQGGSAQADKKSCVGARIIIKTEVFSELLFW